MIGVVNANLEAVVELSVLSSTGADATIDCVIDTGFSGFLTLPRAIIQSLGLPWIAREEGVLADGSVIPFDVYRAVLTWEGQARTIEVQCAEAAPLLGMAMLENHAISISVRVGGEVVIRHES
jgi:clan AA aspartic protease